MPRRLALASALALTLAAPALAEEVVIFAAASLKTALDAAVAEFRATTFHDVTISYAGSNALAQQIIAGAPADIFISAAPSWMDEVEAAGLVVDGTRTDLLGNSLVLVAHGTGAAPVTIAPGFDLAGLLGDGKLSMATVDAVPAGQYGKAALESLQVWSDVEAAVVQSENVRAALVLVARGEAPYGIVYATDARSEDGVTVVGTFPAESHPPIVYPAALLTGAGDAADQAFFAYLTSAAGAAHFRDQGFLVLE